MRILIMTLHCTDNPGSSLQAFALQRYISMNYSQAQIIDYQPRYLLNNGRPIRTFIKRVFGGNTRKRKLKVYKEFTKKYLDILPRTYSTYKSLQSSNLNADYFIVGSDQVWNCSYKCGKDPAYYLQFINTGKKIAYAASLGRSPIPAQDKDFLANHIKDFSAISVREGSSMPVISEIYDGHLQYVCDPTLLLDKKFYDEMALEPVDDNYCITYLAESSPILDKVVAMVRQRYNCRIIQLTGTLNQCNFDTKVEDIGPREWIGYIKKARFVITGSFHATVFSTIYHKNFAAILPRENSARIKQYLEKVGLEHRIITEECEIDRICEIDLAAYSDVDIKIAQFREESSRFLDESIID